jgi:hypothetical protein
MASTFSSLKFELIGTGEQDGTWGDTTNTNLGTAIEQAITGSGDITFASSDVTLTLSNTNSAQIARNLRLVCVGVSGGARQLIVPSIEKQYIVQNDLTDAVTIRTSAGTGVVVPAGKTTVVFNNGTDVVEAITNLNSLSLGNIAVTGVIAGNGSGISAINASNVSSGTLTNARTTANSANGASTIVARDSNGSFAGNAVTATSVTVTSLSTANFTIQQFGTVLAIQYNGTNVAVINSSGNVSASGRLQSGASI